MYCSIRNADKRPFTPKGVKIGEIQEKYVDLETSLKVIKSNKGKRIVFYFEQEIENIEEIKMVSDTYDNVVFKVFTADLAEELRQAELPYFIDYSLFFADSFDKLVYFCKTGVTDVYVTGELGFKLKEVRAIADSYGVKIRVLPNIVQHSGFFATAHMDSICGFWIRPEDLELYEDYIDIIEFAGMDRRQDVLYEIYFLDKQFDGFLSAIIIGFSEHVDNGSLPRIFTESRIDCEKRCNLSKCHRCLKYQMLNKVMGENNLILED